MRTEAHDSTSSVLNLAGIRRRAVNPYSTLPPSSPSTPYCKPAPRLAIESPPTRMKHTKNTHAPSVSRQSGERHSQSSYELLESGSGPGAAAAATTTTSRSGSWAHRRVCWQCWHWRRLVLCVAILLALMYFMDPGVSRARTRLSSLSEGQVPIEKPSKEEDVHPSLPLPQLPKPLDDELSLPPPMPTTPSTMTAAPPIPLSPQAEPCTGRNSYAVMIDAGSTGSRVHVYTFRHCRGASASATSPTSTLSSSLSSTAATSAAEPTYESEVFLKTQPGLSAPSFAGHPEAAAVSLDVLLDEAVRVVPASQRACTPLAVRATAGLRLLGATQSASILDAVRRRVRARYPFVVAEGEEGVRVLEGREEGVFAWMTANYLLGAFRGDAGGGTESGMSYAVLELGGASMQIVFEPRFNRPDGALAEGEHKYDLTFGGRTYTLYQHSYLGYGLMRARLSVHRLVAFMDSLRAKNGKDERKGEVVIGNPCLAKGTSRVINLDDVTGNVTMHGGDIGGFEACNRVMQLVMAKDAICETKPCSFDGVYQPSFIDAFQTGKILLLSYFYDRIHPLLPPTPTPSASGAEDTMQTLPISTLATLARRVCLGRSAWQEHWGADAALLAELEGRPEWCLDLTFMHALLRLGYEFREEREVSIAKRLAGAELGWCLGAAITLVGGAEVKCQD